MKRLRTSPFRRGFGRATLFASLAAACAAVGFAQAGPRVVVESVQIPSRHPVELIGVEVGGEAHKFASVKEGQVLVSVSFDASEDWLRQFAFRIRNRSDKAMLSVTLSGSLGTGEEGDIPMMIETLFGRELDESAFTGRAPRGEPRRLAPGETAEVRWSADEHASMLKFLTKKHPLSAYRKMRIDLREARFEDGTVWTMSGLHRIDPNDPRKWTRIDGGPAAGRDEQPPDLKAGERIVEVDSRKTMLPNDSDALSVTEIKVSGQSVTPGQPFAAGADWLRGLTLRVRNDAAKPIVSAQVHMSFPEASYHGGGLGFSFRYGSTRPGGEGGAAGAKPLLPGEEAELGFTGDDYETQRNFAEKMGGVAEISRVSINMAHVVFADGTRASVSKPVRAPK